MTTNPVIDTFGDLFGYLFVASDITDTRRSQEILVKALQRERQVVARLKDIDQVKDDFITTVSHELRTPMSSIIGSAEMLADGMMGELEPEQQRVIEVITRNGDRLLALADDLLLLAVYDQNSVQEQTVPVDLRAVVEESAGVVAGMLSTRDLDVGYSLPDEPVLVSGDPNHLERAVTNLLTNSVKFTPDGGHVHVAVGCETPAGLGRGQRHRHRFRHRRVRHGEAVRPVLALSARAGASDPGLRPRAADREDDRGESRGADRGAVRGRRRHHVHDHPAPRRGRGLSR